MTPPVAEAVARWAGRLADDGRVPGAAWHVQTPEGPVEGAAGLEGLEPDDARRPATTATRYDLASLTKVLATAPLAVLLAADGSLDLDAPASRLLAPLRGTAWAETTLRALARHESGLPAWRPFHLVARRREAMIEAIAATPPVVAPGRTIYSDLGYILLGAALEVAADAPLDRLFAERIAGPLGVPQLGYRRGGGDATAAPTERGNEYERRLARATPGAGGFRRELIRGAVHDGNAWALDGVAGHAGLFGSVEEVAALARELLAPSVLPLDGAARDALLVAPAGSTRTFGFVTAAGSGAARGILDDAAPGHTGFTGTSLWLDPESSWFAVLLTNRVHPVAADRSFQPVRRAFHRLARP